MSTFNMQTKTLLKTNQIYQQAFAYIHDKKNQFILLAQSKTIHVYNIGQQKFEEDIKISKESGSISCITVSDDLIFFANGMKIGAVYSNGKVIFDFDTYIASDRIQRIHVVGYRLWVISGEIINEFLMGGSQLGNKMSRKVSNPSAKTEDVSSFMFESKINDSILVEEEFSKHYLILLKNNNQIICFEDKKQLTSLKTEAPPLVIIQYPKAKVNNFLIGTMSGQLLFIEVNKKLIKLVQKVQQQTNKGKINSLLMITNQHFVVFREGFVEIWNEDKEMLGCQEIEEKYVSCIFVKDRQMIIGGSTNGNIITMQNYMKLTKNSQNKNAILSKDSLEKEINNLKAECQMLKTKIQTQKKNKNVSNQGINVEITVSIDYQYFCSCLEFKSQNKIVKVILKGKFSIVKCSKLMFSDKDQNGESIFVMEEEGVKNGKIWFKCEQKFSTNQKMKVMAYGQKENKIYGVMKMIDLKPLCYHHKIAAQQLSQCNVMRISGEFKYFEINKYFNMIFCDFGPANQNGDTFNQSFYQSIITKQKLIVRYKNGQCQIKSVNPAPLIVIKQFFTEKSKQYQFNYSYSTELNLDSIKNLVNAISKIIKPLQDLKRQAQLLPGLMEIRNDGNLSTDLKQILCRSDQIAKRQKQSQIQYENLANEVRQAYISYQKLKEHEVTVYELDAFNRQLYNFDTNKIIMMILS